MASVITSKWSDILEAVPDYSPVETAVDCWFDESAADTAIEFFSEHLCFIEGEKAGQPFELEVWQKAIVGNLFGWKRPDGTRRYREAFIFVPRKNGKTPLTAGIINFVAFCDGEPGAQIYSAAGEREQAALVFRHAAGMVHRNKELDKRCRVYRTFKSIEYYNGDSIYKALSADADTKHGLNAHLIINDELHVQPNRDLVDTLETSTASRRQPLIIHITTAGFDKHSICYEKYNYACMVRDGQIQDSKLLPVIYEMKEGDDWKDESVWERVNPNLDVSVSRDYLRSACQEAQDIPAKENTFKRLHLNIWTEQETRWLSMDKWNACPELELDLKGRSCFAGLDMSSTRDVTAFVMVFPVDDKYIVVPKFWIPRESAHQRIKRDKVPYDVWAREGYLTMTDGDAVDYSVVIEDVLKECEKYKLEAVAFDRFGFEAIKQRFIGSGMPEDKMISFGQGFVSMSQPMKELEKMVLSGSLIHNNHPVLSWMASNVTIRQDEAGNIKPDKKRSIEKIDGVVSLAMAIGLATTTPIHPESVYESRGVIAV